MPRFARQHAPGSLQHVIGRFVNREHLFRGPDERAEYLQCLAHALSRCDWTVLGYALMSSHVHLVAVAGAAPPCQLLKPLHVAVARRLNRRLGRLGPVFAERATTVGVPQDRCAELLAYVHNNPVRAHVVRAAEESDWTSQRAYLGLEPAPPWLAAARGLSLAGFTGSAGRNAFGLLVGLLATRPRDPWLSGAALPGARAQLRRDLGLPVELGSPLEVGSSSARLEVQHLGAPQRPSRWGGDLAGLVNEVARRSGVPAEQIVGRCQRREVVKARRLALHTAVRLLGRPVNEAAAIVGLSSSAAVHQLQLVSSEGLGEAAELAALLRREPAPQT